MIESRQKEFDTFFSKHFGGNSQTATTSSAPEWWSSGPVDPAELPPDDKELFTRASAISDKFKKLWGGDWSPRPSQSEGDMALTGILAFMCNNDPQRIDRLFRASGLYRKKWDRDSYGWNTIQKVCNCRQTSAKTNLVQHSTQITIRNPFDVSNLELLSAKQIGIFLPKSRKWFIAGDGGLPQRKLGLVSGSGGTGKSYLGLQIGASIASGINCLGGVLDIRPKGAALLILSEEEKEDLDERLFRIRNSIEQSLNLEQLYCITGAGDYRLVARDRSGNLQPTLGYYSLLELSQAIPGLCFIFIDPLSKFFGAVEEQSNSEVPYFYSLLEMIIQASGANLILSTHANKASTTALKNINHLENSLHQNSVRGASAFVDNARWVMTCCTVPAQIAKKLGAEDNEWLMAWRVAKSNYSATTSMQFFKRGEGGILIPFNMNADMEEIGELVHIIGQLENKVTRRTAIDQIKPKSSWTKAKIKRLINQAIMEDRLFEVPGKNLQGRECKYLTTWVEKEMSDLFN